MDPATASGSYQSFADRALEQLRRWPALQVCDADCGVAVGATQIVHLHQPDKARLCLTRPVIKRLSGALDGNDQVRVEPDSDWVQVRLDSDGDVRLLVSLVSLAIQANSRPAARRRRFG
jgi:hypothetical protein